MAQSKPILKLEAVRTANSVSEANNRALDIIKEYTAEDTLSVSDCLVNIDGGGSNVIEILSNTVNNMKARNGGTGYKWILKCLVDEWGDVPKPGSKIIRRMKLPPIKETGEALTGEEIRIMEYTGEYEQNYIIKREFTVDAAGCITVDLDDAIHFLNIYGVHNRTGSSLANRPAKSVDKFDTGRGKTKRHAHYWRFKELSRFEHEELLPTKNENEKEE